MSVRVVARIRPLLERELDKDVIVRGDSAKPGEPLTVVKIPNPKNEGEEFSFAFNGVYDQDMTQEMLFTAEVAPHLKALFQGLDLTIFAYGVTGTGKTHTMRGGLKLADRGVIPRLLSGIFRRGKKIVRDSAGETAVGVALSYYEIYNDKVYDLLEPPEKRTAAGLPLREKDGKTFVIGLSERACDDLRDFEKLYVEANNNRVTAATKLNAHSSRSHAILRVKLTQTTGDVIRESTTSAIDLAGSEDNRRTDNGKERLIESAAINKSLFVLGQCVDAISRGDKRVPYRESKMTRILSLGQNNGITIMILNLAPLRSYHLDTLSSLNVSSRAKRIEVREIENEVVYKQVPRTNSGTSATGIRRQALRPLANAHNTGVVANTAAAAAAAAAGANKTADADKPVKAFSVYTDKARPGSRPLANFSQVRPAVATKRPFDAETPVGRPTKISRPSLASKPPAAISAAQIEAMVERKVGEILASRAAQDAQQAAPVPAAAPLPTTAVVDVSEAVQRRLDALERRIESEDRKGDRRSEGLRLLLHAKQAKQRGDDAAALEMYESALAFFPGEEKLVTGIDRLRAKLGVVGVEGGEERGGKTIVSRRKRRAAEDESDGDAGFLDRAPKPRPRKLKASGSGPDSATAAPLPSSHDSVPATPRTRKLLDIVNSRDPIRIRALSGFGAKRAADLVEQLELVVSRQYAEAGAGAGGYIETLGQLRTLPGMGWRIVERAYEGLAV